MIEEILEEFMSHVEEVLADTCSVVTMNAAAARPTVGKVAVFVEPPTIQYATQGAEPDVDVSVDIIAGTPITQAGSMNAIFNAMNMLADAGTPISRATPVTFDLAGAGSLAAYQLTISL